MTARKKRCAVVRGYRTAKSDWVPIFESDAITGFDSDGTLGIASAEFPFCPGYLGTITPTLPSQLVVFHVVGRSMEPTLRENDLILADLTVTKPDADGIYLIWKKNCLFVKRLLFSPLADVVHVIADNPLYAPIKCTIPWSEIKAVGRVLLLLTRRLS